MRPARPDIVLPEREPRGNVTCQKAPPIVPLVEKQPDGITFAETQFEPRSVLANLEAHGHSVAENGLRGGFGRRGFADLQLEGFVESAACCVLRVACCVEERAEVGEFGRSQWLG